MWDSWVPPSPNINVGHNLESRTPTDQHWLWGEGFSYFLSLSQILCTWLSEFWLKICYFVESVKNLLLLRGGSNQVWAWPKTIKTTFYDMNHLTPLWPPRSHGGSPSLWNLSLCIKNLCPCNWMESAGLVGCCKHLSSIFGVVNVPHCGRKTEKNDEKRSENWFFGQFLTFRVKMTHIGYPGQKIFLVPFWHMILSTILWKKTT